MYELTPDGFVDNCFQITKDGSTIAEMVTSGDPERDRAVLAELVERANR